jgi:hypothetical protein
MTHPTAQPNVRSAGRVRPGRLEPLVITALYDSREVVDDALGRLHAAGVPRDLIEVVVSRDAAERFYRGRARAPGRETFRFAAIGGLVGLILSAAISIAIVAMPGWQSPGATAVVQLLGPNIGTVGGAAIGAVFGAMRTRRPNRRHARAAENASAILLLVRAQSDADTPALERILEDSGGRAVRVES